MQFSIDQQILAGFRRRSDSARAFYSATCGATREAMQRRMAILREPGVETRFVPSCGNLHLVEAVPGSLTTEQAGRLASAEAEVTRCQEEQAAAERQVNALHDVSHRIREFAKEHA